MTDDLKTAIRHALSGEWEQAHLIVQELGSPMAAWIHAVLHKIEGDESNSRYWYARAKRNYEDFEDPTEELKHIDSAIS
ncbi:MAG TPA: hypothetical protein VEA39_06810 [Methylophilaceae bacterium]|nr:hypothetical protein [Methylophilaceae bacterium]